MMFTPARNRDRRQPCSVGLGGVSAINHVNYRHSPTHAPVDISKGDGTAPIALCCAIPAFFVHDGAPSHEAGAEFVYFGRRLRSALCVRVAGKGASVPKLVIHIDDPDRDDLLAWGRRTGWSPRSTGWPFDAAFRLASARQCPGTRLRKTSVVSLDL